MKGTSPEEFSRLTGAKPEAFHFQLKALKNLLDMQVSFHPALMVSFSSNAGIQQLQGKLAEIDQSLTDRLEEENVILYPPVVKRLKKAGIQPNR